MSRMAMLVPIWIHSARRPVWLYDIHPSWFQSPFKLSILGTIPHVWSFWITQWFFLFSPFHLSFYIECLWRRYVECFESDVSIGYARGLSHTLSLSLFLSHAPFNRSLWKYPLCGGVTSEGMQKSFRDYMSFASWQRNVTHWIYNRRRWRGRLNIQRHSFEWAFAHHEDCFSMVRRERKWEKRGKWERVREWEWKREQKGWFALQVHQVAPRQWWQKR